MTKVFKATAGACFNIDNTDQTITVEGVEFVYVAGADRDAHAANAVGAYIDQNVPSLSTKPLRLVWVETSKAAEITQTPEESK
jgi:ribosomal protein L24